MPLTTLFRAEAVAARQGNALGGIRIAQPFTYSAVAAVSGLLAVMLLGYAVLGQFTRKAKLSGILVPQAGQVDLTAASPGVVADVFVREGMRVEARQPLLRLRSDRQTALGEVGEVNALALNQRREALLAERSLAEQQARQLLRTLQERQASLARDEQRLMAELALSRHRTELAQRRIERYSDLAGSGFLSTLSVQEKQEELIDLQLRVRSAERSQEAIQRELASTVAEQRAAALNLETSLAQIDRNLALLQQERAENEARTSQTITAPSAGRVSALSVQIGQALQAGQWAVSLTADSAGPDQERLQAQLFAPSRLVGFIEPGQQVWLRYAAYPHHKFGMAAGTIRGISRTPVNASDLPASQRDALLQAAQSNEPLYRIDVELAEQQVRVYGQPRSLMAGMKLEADVVQERLAIWEWMLAPVLSATARAPTLH